MRAHRPPPRSRQVTALLVLFALFVGQVSFWSTGWYSMTGTAIGCAALIVWSAWPQRLSTGPCRPNDQGSAPDRGSGHRVPSGRPEANLADEQGEEDEQSGHLTAPRRRSMSAHATWTSRTAVPTLQSWPPSSRWRRIN